MKAENKNHEWSELLKELDMEPQEAQAMLHEVQEGQRWLAQQPEPELPAGLLERVEKKCLQSHRRVVRYPYWLTRAAAVILVALISIPLLRTITRTEDARLPQPQPSATNELYSNELDVWEVALTMEDHLEREADDVTLSEMMTLWEEAGWETDNLLEMETQDETETDTLGYDTVRDNRVA